MSLAEKIMKLRKEQGWSQETLASMLDVSRQSVSKWEIGTSVPDLDKIIKMSEIFGVTTDYLLKEDFNAFTKNKPEEESTTSSFSDFSEEKNEKIRSLNADEAFSYLDFVVTAAKQIGIGVSLCILSPICLILLAGLAECPQFSLSENQASGIGVTILFLLVAIAVSLFISKGLKLSKYEYLDKEAISLDEDIYNIVKERQHNFEEFFKKSIVIGVTLCICSLIPYFIAVAFDSPSFVYVCCTAVLLAIIAVAVYLFVYAGMIYGSFQRLLEEGDYTREKKMLQKQNEMISQLYWGLVVALYLGYSLLTMNWHKSWVIWPCAGVLYAAAMAFANLIRHCTEPTDFAGK